MDVTEELGTMRRYCMSLSSGACLETGGGGGISDGRVNPC